MSFRCEFCKEPQVSGVRPTLVVVKVRRRHYNSGDGWEIMCEKKACDSCAEKEEDVGKTLRVSLNPYAEQPGFKHIALDQLMEVFAE